MATNETQTGYVVCDHCGAQLTADEISRNTRENEAAQYDANASYCDRCAENLESDAEED
jgi:hypothetical protein